MKSKLFYRLAGLCCQLLIGVSLASCSKADAKMTTVTPIGDSGATTPVSGLPVLTGKLVYHSYDTYGGVSKMYLYDFVANQLTWISQHWNIYDPMNAQFNSDGTRIVFMGEATAGGKWDIYLWTVGSSDQPVNLTAGDGCRDEDPKFSPNGYRICFKQTPAGGNGNLKIMEISSNTITNNVTNNTIESGMPYYSDDASSLLYARGAGASSDIYMVNIDGTNNHSLANVSGVDEYYPIVLGDSAFLYTRWYSSSNQHDQVYLGYFSNSTRTRLLFNASTDDYSDAYPCGAGQLILSCDKSGGGGAYDLYVADMSTGSLTSLSSYNAGINTAMNELGACYIK